MIKTILVPASGSATDHPVFATALAAARALTAHLDFYHVRLSEGQAAVGAPHFDFCAGAGVPAALHALTAQVGRLSEAASGHVKSFCREYAVEICDAPRHALSVSASMLEEQDHARDRLLFQARHSDLMVLGRPSHTDYLPRLLIEDLLMGCGRPILIAPDRSPKSLTGTVVVGWKETTQSARALAAAYPFLERAETVILLHIIEGGVGICEALADLAQRLKWHGICVETRSVASSSRRLTDEVSRVAADLHADLLVIGAYGHRPVREDVFGGVTRSVLDQAEVPVLMMH